VIGALNLFVEWHLRFDYCLGGFVLDSHPAHEIGQLDIGRTGDDDHSVAESFTSGFIKKRNVCKEKFGRCAVLVRFSSPLPANPGMKNLFERLLFGGVLEDYRSKSRPVQVTARGKNAESELVEQLLFNFLNIDQIVSRLIGIEKPGGGQDLAQTLAKSAFAGGNSPGNPDSWHLFRYVACVGIPRKEDKNNLSYCQRRDRIRTLMPYIKPERRNAILAGAKPQDAGELNFAITVLVDNFLKDKGEIRYSHLNEVIGALDCAKLELYRRVAAPYEDEKIAENGDVYHSNKKSAN